jgi:hypothetical protein
VSKKKKKVQKVRNSILHSRWPHADAILRVNDKGKVRYIVVESKVSHSEMAAAQVQRQLEAYADSVRVTTNHAVKEDDRIAFSLEPLKMAQRLLSVLLKGDESTAGIGDLTEKYERRRRLEGTRKANSWLCREVAESILPLILRLGGRIGLWILGEWIKRHTSSN